MAGFIEKHKVSFNSAKNIVAKRHLYLSGVLSEDNINEVLQEFDDNRAKLKDNRLEGKFVSKNVINLSQRQVTKSDFLLLSEGLKFVPTPNRIDKVNVKKVWRFLGENLN